MQTTRMAIVGGGLSGLYAAWLLEQRGIHDYVVLEARDVPGGRIASFPATGTQTVVDARDRFDLGPTWFWPDYQRELQALINALGLACFAQFERGDMMVERSADAPPMRTRGYVNSPTSMRLIGGMGALVDALHAALPAGRVLSGQRVRGLRRLEQGIELDSEDANGRITTWRTEHVLLALPPRLIAHDLVFSPPLPEALIRQWRHTETWMAPHAKYLAVYEHPFWREQGLSGEARSAVGPMAEIHDASMPDGHAALFGFLGIPATVRQRVSDGVLREHCRAQFTRLFGTQAAAPVSDVIKDWAFDPLTATEEDISNGGQHPQPPATTANSGPWQLCLTGIGSEWSRQFPGYLAGAIDAARLGVEAWAAATASAPMACAASLTDLSSKPISTGSTSCD